MDALAVWVLKRVCAARRIQEKFGPSHRGGVRLGPKASPPCACAGWRILLKRQHPPAVPIGACSNSGLTSVLVCAGAGRAGLYRSRCVRRTCIRTCGYSFRTRIEYLADQRGCASQRRHLRSSRVSLPDGLSLLKKFMAHRCPVRP